MDKRSTIYTILSLLVRIRIAEIGSKVGFYIDITTSQISRLSMTSASSIVGGIFLIFLAGIFNGSWNAAFSPQLNLAVTDKKKKDPAHEKNKDEESMNEENKTKEDCEEPINDLMYHHAFALFQIYATAINIPICIYWAGGPSRVSAVLKATDVSSILLVVLFSIIWGIGTLLFGLACQIAGVGLGTNLTIGVVAVIGTLLPLLTEQTLVTPAGGVILFGLFVCCIGLWISTKALKQRDADEIAYVSNKEGHASHNKRRVQEDDQAVQEQQTDTKNHSDQQIQQDETKNEENIISESSMRWPKTLRTSRYVGLKRLTASFRKTPARREKEQAENPAWKKIGVCILAGICCVQLQFAFIFGSRISDLSNGTDIDDDSVLRALPGSTPESGGAAIIWMLAISLGAPPSIINAIISSPVPLSSAIRTPWWRHLKLIATTSLPWISHIHIYGVCASTLFPERIAASIGWPMLMMVTTAQGTLLSVFLGEWKIASAETWRTLKISLLTSFIGVAILMASIAAPNK